MLDRKPNIGDDDLVLFSDQCEPKLRLTGERKWNGIYFDRPVQKVQRKYGKWMKTRSKKVLFSVLTKTNTLFLIQKTMRGKPEESVSNYKFDL